jgi:hypothetical protein
VIPEAKSGRLTPSAFWLFSHIPGVKHPYNLLKIIDFCDLVNYNVKRLKTHAPWALAGLAPQGLQGLFPATANT